MWEQPKSFVQGMVYIVEDDLSFCRSLQCLLHALGFKTDAFGNAQTFLQKPNIERPACLLLDVNLPDMDGLRLQQALNDLGRMVPIIFMTGYGTIPLSVRAMKQGAFDFLPKPLDAEELQRAICRALESDLLSWNEEVQKERARSLLGTLTSREREVLRWIITGRLNKQIAFTMGITEKTIKVHRGRVFQKTGVSSVADLVRLAEKVGITPAE